MEQHLLKDGSHLLLGCHIPLVRASQAHAAAYNLPNVHWRGSRCCRLIRRQQISDVLLSTPPWPKL